MKKTLALTMCLSAFGAAHAIVLDGGSGGVITRSTSIGHSGTLGQLVSFMPTNMAGFAIARVNSVTLRGLSHARLSSLEMRLESPVALSYLYYTGFESAAGINGDITFRAEPSLLTLNARSRQVSTVGSGSYQPTERGPLGALRTGDLSGMIGSPLANGIMLSILNGSTTIQGSLSGWSIDVEATPVPEPASLSALAIGAFVIARRRRAR